MVDKLNTLDKLNEADKVWLECLPKDQLIAGVAYVRWKTMLYPDVTKLPPGQIFMEAFELGRGIRSVAKTIKEKAYRQRSRV
jgi:hypothetical protein